MEESNYCCVYALKKKRYILAVKRWVQYITSPPYIVLFFYHIIIHFLNLFFQSSFFLYNKKAKTCNISQIYYGTCLFMFSTENYKQLLFSKCFDGVCEWLSCYRLKPYGYIFIIISAKIQTIWLVNIGGLKTCKNVISY